MSKENLNKISEFGPASSYALKSDLVNVYRYKGSRATTTLLPTTDLTVGDVYNVEATGMNYAWTGTDWDALGMISSGGVGQAGTGTNSEIFND